jgi:hypothetical protein
MEHKSGCLASTRSGAGRRASGRTPVGNGQNTSWSPQLLIVAASLALWTLIIGTGAMIFN